MRKSLSTLLFFLFMGIATQAQIVTYPVPPQLYYSRHNDDYTVQVRQAGTKEWIDLYEYKVLVDTDTRSETSMVQFDCRGKVEVKIRKNNGHIHDVEIRPLAKNIKPKVKGQIVYFTLDKPEKLSVEFNGDRLHNLHLFANPLEEEVPVQGTPGLIYFEPGYHQPDSAVLRIPSHTTVYLAPGAVVKAKLLVDKAEDVRILGRGFLDQPQRGIEVTDSKNVSIEGITVLNPIHYTVYGGNATGLTIRNLKSFSCHGWADGIDMMCCHDVLVDDVFLRTSDDCIAIYAHRWDYYGGTDRITVQNSTLWADIAHPINIGGHGDPDSPTGETVENITLRNIDILEHDEDDVPYQGCMTVDCGDKNFVRNILFEDIRVESIQEGQLFHISVRFNEKYDKQPGRGIDGVTFRNITYRGYGENPSLIKGLDAGRLVRNVTFDHVRINGKRMKNLDGFDTNGFVQNIIVK